MLPIETVIPQICETIQHQDCILIAPPGAGKSTYLPLQLLALKHFSDTRIIMLQPRQVAARSIARYLSQQLGEKLGQTVGYQVRGDAKFCQETRLLIMTEGLLTARLQSDPELEGVGLLIFDEFHERSIYSDIAFGLSLEVQQGLREDLRLLVMSATLDVKGLSTLLPKANVLSCEGRVFPITYFYRPLSLNVSNKNASGYKNSTMAFKNHLVTVIQEAVFAHDGHILVFLSGAADIYDIEQRLRQLDLPNIIVAPLLGALSSEAQQLAIEVPDAPTRKIVLATNIAETSLTINGVSVVIDTGREKVQRFNLSRGGNTLIEQHISKASSVQRAGRAGRQQAGVCYRLWDEHKQQYLVEASKAEITHIDISRELLMLLEWGTNFSELPLIDRPTAAQLDVAFTLLATLGLVNKDKQLNSQGKAAAQFNTHPRLAKLLMLAKHSHKSHAYLIALIVSVLEGRPLYKEAASINLADQIRFLTQQKRHPMQQDVKRWCKLLGVTNTHLDMDALPSLVLCAYSDKLGRHISQGQFSMFSGSAVAFHPKEYEKYSNIGWICAVDLNFNQGVAAQLRLFCAIPLDIMQEVIEAKQQSQLQVTWDASLQRVTCKKLCYLGNIKLSEQAIEAPNDENTLALVAAHIQTLNTRLFSEQVNNYITRINIAASESPNLGFPDMRQSHFYDDWQTWLAPFLHKISALKQIEKMDWLNIIKSRLSWEQQQSIEHDFPVVYISPIGNKHTLQYRVNEDGTYDVILAIRLQELYGLDECITVGKRNTAITLSLLSPAKREIQKTRDLPGFWQGSYREVQKEMKGRYPKHFWPDDPANAMPTSKTKKWM